MATDNRTEGTSYAERAKRILTRACDTELSIATAESCTGGMVASLLTDIEGCSHAFDRGFVVYTDAAKREMLGVDPDLLERLGAVSREVAIAMAEGALRRSDADLAISITGYAGPTKTNGNEGDVHLALAREGQPTIHRFEQFGSLGRDRIRELCLETALGMFEEDLL